MPIRHSIIHQIDKKPDGTPAVLHVSGTELTKSQVTENQRCGSPVNVHGRQFTGDRRSSRAIVYHLIAAQRNLYCKRMQHSD